ncbi:hypothetical protein K7185_10460 [Clostridium butyricum]|uniref:glycosyltransferase family 32 protein n=1 Tax=Clostridium butyricum TaxID=1492 RepID=UPI001CAA116C|nr:glycosyltransferase [Clostridium butyricum]MBZ0312896.1 hypothetical protein [Clostridium butyricum]
MVLKNLSLKNFIYNISKNKNQLILFGSGVLANTFIKYIEKLNIDIKIKYIVDNDINKHGKVIEACDLKIYNPEVLDNIENKKIVILITSSYYYEIVKQLDICSNLYNVDCYILPIMYATNLNKSKNQIINKHHNMLIPKKIHYMWFGTKKLPYNLQKCVDSWKKFCPDYEIIRWNESNYDILKCEYTSQAYERKAWGFIPDYARLDILYEHGGIYMDTDVELIKNLDEMLYQKAFCSIEKWNVINFGGCSGSIPGNSGIEKILNIRKNIKFVNEDGSLNTMASGYYDTLPFINEGYIFNGKNQCVEDMNIYAYDYFHPYDYMTGKLELTENTFGIHHFNGGWINDKYKIERLRTQKKYNEVLSRMEV